MSIHNAPRQYLNWGTSLGLLLILGLAVELLLQQYGLRQQQAEQQRLLAHANEVRAVLLGELNATLHLATGLATYIPAKAGRIDPAELEPWLKGLFQQGRHIRNIGLAPGNRLTFIYPLAGNEAALGLYYPDTPKQWPVIERIIASAKPMLDGPLLLVQGGQGLIYRVPVFLPDQSYWGLISTVIDFDRLYAEVEAVARQRGLSISLLPLDGALPQQSAEAEAINLVVPVAGASWQLQARALEPLQPLPLGLRLLGWGLALTVSLLIGLALHSQQRRASLLLALNQSQRDFLQAFERAPQSMALVDNRGCLLVVNQAFCRLLQLHATQLVRQPLEHFCVPEERADLLQHLAAIRPGPNRSWTQHLLDAHQQRIAVECSAAILGPVADTDQARILHIQDIRERQRLQRLQNEFTASVSHELRTPLTAIAGALGLINGGALGEVPPAMAELLQIAQANSQRLQALISDLLDMEKLLAGQMRFELREQPLWPLLQDAVAHNQPYASQHQVTLQLQEPAAPLSVRVDAQRLSQVMANLLSNAAKFSPPGSQVTVSAEDLGDRVRIAVRDRGPGICEEFRPRIFSKFAQADGSDRRQKGGTGLGLAISKELVERMQGDIGFDTAAGNGTTFWFELPVSTSRQESSTL
ncbi:ATP-binding protein [Pseudomonas xionganensis]|uniref:histidine kinase n=1 Tax=Pseudomonas xionganensis TaxID=2654845 RepID=A0A6I4KWW9_9PSED|nr:ATP-binding protein [Pseudomonas xionganensis]MVW74233.1 PAS domain S-box protein [Pseudomonas xionganensis]